MDREVGLLCNGYLTLYKGLESGRIFNEKLCNCRAVLGSHLLMTLTADGDTRKSKDQE